MAPVVLRPATRADIAALSDDSVPHRLRAWAAERDGEVLAVGGLAFHPGGSVSAFLDLAADPKTFALSLHKAGKLMMNTARDLRLKRVVATAQPDRPSAVAWLKRFGFEPLEVGDQTVWVWSA